MKETDFCPTCRYYLYLKQEKVDDKDILRRICRNCGYQEEDREGGLILEIDLKQKTSEGYKILLNEFTKQDPTLPHVNTIKCPEPSCKSNVDGAERDVIYIKYDAVNLKFLYICNVCDTQWRSKAS
uniref:DNA-directed RNA polymerase M/15kDa subunit domain-containing protein n=1 Tax=viral metagenome TaxID=1070528 RepID=A0A6C0KL65_9ZZZZ